MERALTWVFDGLNMEEVKRIIPESMSVDLGTDMLLRIQEGALRRLHSAKTEAAKKTIRSGKRIKTFLIAAAIIIMMTAGALAVTLNGGRFLEELFGSRNYDAVSNYVLGDLAQVCDENLTLTLESALSDGHYYWVVFSVERTDGGSVNGLFPDVNIDFTLENPSRVKPAFQMERLETEENSESHAHFITLIRSSVPVTAMELKMKRFYTVDGSLSEVICDLSVGAEFKPCPVARGGETEGVFRNIELSPFSLWVDVFEPWENSDALSESFPIHDVYIRYKDGTLVGARADQFADEGYMEEIGWGGIQYPDGTGKSLISIRFTGFIDIETVESVVIDGADYPLNIATGTE